MSKLLHVFFTFIIIIFSTINAQSNEKLDFVFFGTSTFLIENDEHQFFIDAFLTRSPNGIWKRLSPNTEYFQNLVHVFQICPSKSTNLKKSDPAICHTNGAKTLEWILPMHGHYDHALDAGLLSLWSGAKLAGDQSIEAVLSATRDLNPASMNLSKWRSNKSHVDLNIMDQTITAINFGDINVKLIHTPHGKNIFSGLLKGNTSSQLQFPAHFSKLKEGAAISIHVKSGSKKYLFIPSPGEIGTIFSQNDIKADIVFLGIGGTCSASPARLKTLWQNSVLSVSASKVFLIHWDNTLGLSPFPIKQIKPYQTCLKSKVMNIFKKFASEGNIKLFLPPFFSKFDPYTYNNEF